jgi:hypothetical protein
MLAEAVTLLHDMPVLMLSPEAQDFIGVEAEKYIRHLIEHKKRHAAWLLELLGDG